MVTQIYSIQTVEEALGCVEAGVDYIGMASGTNSNLPAEISLEEGKKIFAVIGDKAKKVALAVADTPEPILEMIEALQPDVIHVCGNNYSVTPDFCDKARAICPGIAIEQAIAITGPQAVEQAVHFGKFCDTLILDSVDPTIAGVGAAGIVNDWNICAEIVQKTQCNVILAGGLGPDNVAESIEKVRPWGVDSLTKTSTKFPDGTMLKDIDKVKAFVKNAHEKAAELGL